MKAEASATEIRALMVGLCELAAIVASGSSTIEPEPESSEAKYDYLVIQDDEIYQIRERETGELSQSNGRNIKPGDSIITDDGEYVVPKQAFRRREA